MKKFIKQKTKGILSIGEGFEYSEFGVNYKLFQNCCDWKNSFYYKKLSRKLTWIITLWVIFWVIILEMNRPLNRLVHIDISADEFGTENIENCIFVEDRDLYLASDSLISIISQNPDDIRPFIANFYS